MKILFPVLCRLPLCVRGLASKGIFVLLLLSLSFAQGCAARSGSEAQAKSYTPAPTSSSTSSKTLNGSLISTARSQKGLKYRRGGNSPATGFDCSGFVCWTYDQHGVKMPRTSREQMQVGTPVGKDQLKPGDLVAFKISSRRGYHTGIYTGNGMFIHSPSSGKTIAEEPLDSDYWKKRYIGGRRVK